MKVVTFGTFDHLHEGHKAYLQFAQAKGDLYIIVARDKNVEHIKGAKPDNEEQDRVQAVQAAFPNAVVELGDAENYLKPLANIEPDLIVLGYDQQLPPGISEADLPCPVERAQSHNPGEFKSSLIRQNRTS